jgi:tetratricopeptide (TPR) repeat protein
MTTRLAGVGVLLCSMLAGPLAAAEPVSAQRLWEQGQDAMREGRTDVAVGFYERSLALDPNLVNNHLSLAAAYLDKGDDEQALPHLAQYVAAKPNHIIVRAHYAELLLRLGDDHAAVVQYERFDADVQEHEELAKQELVRCHSRLMEIAERQEDAYAAHLHRGIGLYLLACHGEQALPEDETFSTESLLCKAAGELTLARRQRPEESRPCWYLFEVWSQLAQRQPAARCLRAAEEAAPFSYLTPMERRNLLLAARGLDLELSRK